MTTVITSALVPTTTTSTGEQSHSFKTWEVVLQVTIMVLIMITTFFGNILVCLCIYLKEEMRTVTAMFLVNLAIADLGTGLFCIPMAIAAIFKVSILRDDVTCHFNAFCLVFFFLASINTMAATSVYKYLMVGFPLSQISKRSAFIVVILIWTISLILALGPVFGWSHYYLLVNRYQCTPKNPENLNEYSHLISLLLLGYALPVPVMTFCYARVYCISKSHFKRMKQNAVYDVSLLKSETHLIGTLWIVLVVFVLCWLPFVVYIMFGMLDAKVPLYLPILAFMFGYSNSFLNPIVYALRLKSFRKGFKEIIISFCKKKELAPAYLTYSGTGNAKDAAGSSADTLKTSLPRNALRKASLAHIIHGSNNKSFVIEEGEKALKSRKISRYVISGSQMYPRISSDNTSGKINRSFDSEDGRSKEIRENNDEFHETVAVLDPSKKVSDSNLFSTNNKPIQRLYPRISRDESLHNGGVAANSTIEATDNAFESERFDDVIHEEDACQGIELNERVEVMDSDERNRVINLTETRYETFTKVLSLCHNLSCKSPRGQYQISRRINACYDIHVISVPSQREIEQFGVPCIHKVLRTLTSEDTAYDSLGNVVMKVNHDVARNEAIDTSALPSYMREHVRLET